MSYRRFYIHTTSITPTTFTSTDPELCHRLHSVLRLRPGEFIQIFNDQKKEALLQINTLDKKTLTGTIQKILTPKLNPTPQTHIYQALTKPITKFESVLQKSTELGTTSITPLITTRTEIKPPKKTDRWQKILLSATEQCGRSQIPTLAPTLTFTNLLKNPPPGITLLTYENKTENLLSHLLPTLKKSPQINLLIGPEGGWTETEIQQAQNQNIHLIGLGPLILRTETVAPALLSAIYLS